MLRESIRILYREAPRHIGEDGFLQILWVNRKDGNSVRLSEEFSVVDEVGYRSGGEGVFQFKAGRVPESLYWPSDRWLTQLRNSLIAIHSVLREAADPAVGGAGSRASLDGDILDFANEVRFAVEQFRDREWVVDP